MPGKGRGGTKRKGGKHQVRQFNIERAEENRIWLIIGARNTGKTVLLRDIMYHLRHKIDVGVAMTATVSTADMLKRVLPEQLVHTDGYNERCADEFLRSSKELVKNGKTRRLALIMDDCMFDSGIMKSKTQSELHLNGRHYHTSILNTTQYVMAIPPLIRWNVDYIFALKEPVRANRRKLYEYFYGVFPSFGEFEHVFQSLTNNHGCMVLDRTNKGTDWRSMVRHYSASLHIPPFHIGVEPPDDRAQHQGTGREKENTHG